MSNDNVVKFEKKKNEDRTMIVNILDWLAMVKDTRGGITVTETHVNQHVVDSSVTTKNESQLFNAFTMLQLRHHDMIGQYEPWRRWDNFLFAPVQTTPEAVRARAVADETNPPSTWIRFARHMQILATNLREILTDITPFTTMRIWALPRDDDDHIDYQLRRHTANAQSDGKLAPFLRFKMIEPHPTAIAEVELWIPHQDTHIKAGLGAPLYLSAVRDQEEQASFLYGWYTINSVGHQIRLLTNLAQAGTLL